MKKKENMENQDLIDLNLVYEIDSSKEKIKEILLKIYKYVPNTEVKVNKNLGNVKRIDFDSKNLKNDKKLENYSNETFSKENRINNICNEMSKEEKLNDLNNHINNLYKNNEIDDDVFNFFDTKIKEKLNNLK